MPSFINKLVSYFITGLVLILPLVLTIWVFYYFVSLVQQAFSFDKAIVGLSVSIVIILVIGYFANSFASTLLWSKAEKYIIRLPLIGLIYKAIKDVTTAFVGTDNKFSEPVLVKFTNEELYKVGFVTNKDIKVVLEINNVDTQSLIAVYFPLSFSLSGDLYLISSERIIPIHSKAKDVMQVIVSGGLIKAQTEKSISQIK